MSTLPGNPHANIDGFSDDVDWAQVKATLAVAHELRTANLIALFSTPLAAHTEIATRLGLGGEGQ